MEAYDQASEGELVIDAQPKHPSFPTCTKSPMDSTSNNSATQPLQIRKLTPDAMNEWQLLCNYYNCNKKYFRGHKCKEKKLFQIEVTPQDSPKDNIMDFLLSPYFDNIMPPIEDAPDMPIPKEQP